MYLIDEEIEELISKGKLKNVEIQNIDSVSFDIHICGIITDSGEEIVKELEPGETVIVSCNEEIEMPNDMIGLVIQKNSRLRSGITVSAPVYRPGHNTRIFIAVTNSSANKIEIAKGESIGAFMLDKLDKTPKNTYNGTFQGEHNYKGLGNYKEIWEIHAKKANDKYASVKDLEKSIYGTVMTLMTIFIAIFSLINFEVKFITETTVNITNLLLYNFVFIGGISLLICLINCILPYGGTKNKKWLFLIPIVCFIMAIVYKSIVQL